METVFFVPLPPSSSLEQRTRALKKILKVSDFDSIVKRKDKTAVKTHVGEKRNTTHISPRLIKVIVERVKRGGALPFLTETSTLYRGQRSNAIDHLNHAYSHGFSPDIVGAPFIMADGLAGNSEQEVSIPGQIFDTVNIAREAVFADALVVVSHPTGHSSEGIGACIKNLGMGLASRKGKLRMHSSVKPSIRAASCTFCGQCMVWCPEDAIVEKEGKAFILQQSCIGCGECLAVCRFDAVMFNWQTQSADLQRRTAEHAYGAVIDKKDKLYCINVLTDMTRDCDCLGQKQEPILPDLGILASRDPVAIDQATLDLTQESFGRHLGEASYPELDSNVQIQHGEKIGMGSRKYRLLKVDV